MYNMIFIKVVKVRIRYYVEDIFLDKLLIIKG